MKVYLNSIVGIDDAIVALLMSKRSWTREKEYNFRSMVDSEFHPVHGLRAENVTEVNARFDEWMKTLIKIGTKHITLFRFIDFSFTVEGLHRAGQDDWDSHAKRFENRIIRSSTRLATFGDEKSAWYQDKILSTDDALDILSHGLPDQLEYNNAIYVRAVNGYIREDYKDNPDAKRGLYMLSIPSNFIFKINLTEWCHVYKERNKNGNANPEVKELCETIADLIEERTGGYFNRDLFEAVKN